MLTLDHNSGPMVVTTLSSIPNMLYVWTCVCVWPKGSSHSLPRAALLNTGFPIKPLAFNSTAGNTRLLADTGFSIKPLAFKLWPGTGNWCSRRWCQRCVPLWQHSGRNMIMTDLTVYFAGLARYQWSPSRITFRFTQMRVSSPGLRMLLWLHLTLSRTTMSTNTCLGAQ